MPRQPANDLTTEVRLGADDPARDQPLLEEAASLPDLLREAAVDVAENTAPDSKSDLVERLRVEAKSMQAAWDDFEARALEMFVTGWRILDSPPSAPDLTVDRSALVALHGDIKMELLSPGMRENQRVAAADGDRTATAVCAVDHTRLYFVDRLAAALGLEG